MTCVWVDGVGVRSKECHYYWEKSLSWSRRMFGACLLSPYCWRARHINQLVVISRDSVR